MGDLAGGRAGPARPPEQAARPGWLLRTLLDGSRKVFAASLEKDFRGELDPFISPPSAATICAPMIFRGVSCVVSLVRLSGPFALRVTTPMPRTPRECYLVS